MHGTPQGAIKVAEELVSLEESLAGNTSDLYLRADDELAREYEFSGDPGRAIAIFRRNAEISDLAFVPGDIRRAQTRMTAAMALAQHGLFDEAEKLAAEAVAISQAMRPPQGGMFAGQLELIRKMSMAPQPNATNGNNRGFVNQNPRTDPFQPRCGSGCLLARGVPAEQGVPYMSSGQPIAPSILDAVKTAEFFHLIC
jgi:hypothetical protein